MRQVMQVDMLGGLSVAAGEVAVFDSAGKVTKPWQVFCYLLLNRDEPVPPARLISALWSEETLTDPNNVLKNTIYALRREFRGCPGECARPILFKNGGYQPNPEVDFIVDAQQMDALCAQAAETADAGARAVLLQQAQALYKGELLPGLAEEGWVAARALYYRKRYEELVEALCAMLYEGGHYSELLAAATAANKTVPRHPGFLLYLFRALYALGMYKVILPVYQRNARLFGEAMGAALPDEVREIYAAASEKVSPVESDILSIKGDLLEVFGEGRSAEGPLYCTYDVFKYLYQMVARTAERTGSRILIILVSLRDADGGQPTAGRLDAAMAEMKNCLLGGLLRKSDTVARYSQSQYILMLSSDQPDGAEAVTARLGRQCGPWLAGQGMQVQFSTTEFDPATEL